MSSKREGSFRPAAPLVFGLRSEVNMQGPLQHLCLMSPLYSLSETQCKVINPFQADCDFSISLLHCSSEALMAANKPADCADTQRCRDHALPLSLLALPHRSSATVRPDEACVCVYFFQVKREEPTGELHRCATPGGGA